MNERGMTFQDCVLACAANRGLVSEFDRLTGYSIGGAAAPINRMVDEATGFEEAGLRAFIRFVAEFVWLPLICEPATEGVPDE